MLRRRARIGVRTLSRAGRVLRHAPLYVRDRTDESALSIWCRLAVRAGYADLAEFMKTTGSTAKPGLAPWRLSSLEALAVVSGQPLEELIARTPRETPAGLVVGTRVITTKTRLTVPGGVMNDLICPACLLDDRECLDGPVECRPYRRFWWAFSFIGCPKHRQPLTDRCSSCDTRLKATRVRVDVCSCGADLAAARHRPAEFASLDAALLESLSRPCGEWLDSYDLYSAHKLALAIGLYLLKYPRAITRSALAANELMEVASFGHQAVQRTGGDLRAVIREGAQLDGQLSMRAVFGSLAAFYNACRGRACYAPFSSALVNEWTAIESSLVGDPNKRPMAMQAGPFTVQELADLHSTDVPLLAEHLAQISATNACIWEVDVRVPRDIADTVRLRIGKVGSADDVGLILGLSRRVVLDLTKLGAVRQHSVFGARSQKVFDLVDLREFLGSLSRNVPRYVQVPPGLVPIMFRKVEGGVAALLLAMRLGELRCQGVLEGLQGVRSLLVDAEDVFQRFPSYEAGGESPRPLCGSRVGLSCHTKARLISDNVLRAVPFHRGSRICRSVTRESLAEFQACFATSLGLAAEFGIAEAEVIDRLRAAGVDGACFGSKSYRNVFARSAATAALAAFAARN